MTGSSTAYDFNLKFVSDFEASAAETPLPVVAALLLLRTLLLAAVSTAMARTAMARMAMAAAPILHRHLPRNDARPSHHAICNPFHRPNSMACSPTSDSVSPRPWAMAIATLSAKLV